MRERILSEIRRIATQNGGMPPGKKSFHQETGISESDWYGEIWFSWRDAVSEAGFTPNEMQKRMSDDYVLACYSEACQHFGHPPTSAELRFYSRKTPNFPSHNVFASHFGSKSGVISALREKAIKEGDRELVSMLPEIQKTSDQEKNKRHDTGADGYVYLLKSGSHFKIGRSENVEKRIKQISVSLPEKVELVHVIRTDDTAGIEAYWHRRFAESRANGEWFNLSLADVRAFKRRKFQ